MRRDRKPLPPSWALSFVIALALLLGACTTAEPAALDAQRDELFAEIDNRIVVLVLLLEDTAANASTPYTLRIAGILDGLLQAENYRAIDGVLAGLIEVVRAQSGKSIPEADASEILAAAEELATLLDAALSAGDPLVVLFIAPRQSIEADVGGAISTVEVQSILTATPGGVHGHIRLFGLAGEELVFRIEEGVPIDDGVGGVRVHGTVEGGGGERFEALFEPTEEGFVLTIEPGSDPNGAIILPWYFDSRGKCIYRIVAGGAPTPAPNNALRDIDEGDIDGARTELVSFLDEVEAQRGKKISESDADARFAFAQRILATL